MSSSVPTLWTVTHQAPLSMEFSRQEYWSELPCPPPGDLFNPGIEPKSPTLQVDSLPLSHQRSPKFSLAQYKLLYIITFNIQWFCKTERNKMHCFLIIYTWYFLFKKSQISLQGIEMILDKSWIICIIQGLVQFSSLSHVWLFVTAWTAACQASLSITNSQSSLKLMCRSCSHLILCRPLLILPPIPPSIRVFCNESTLHMRWPKCWSFSFSIIPSKEVPGLISFRMDWLDLLAVQGTLKSLLQHHNSKASILWCSAFFTVQLSHPYMTTGKTIALTRWPLLVK